ncbi:PIN domain-containing protein [Candidatus Magnetomoraceae bacterium gMMP-15]
MKTSFKVVADTNVVIASEKSTSESSPNREFFDLPLYPSDPDDIAFLLCAENGNATHIVSYDPHLKEIDRFYTFRVCGTLKFLFELRKEISKKKANPVVNSNARKK